MKHLLALISVLVFLTSVTKGEICPDAKWGTPTSTLGELVRLNLEGDGPADGDCGEKDKWIVLGDIFKLPSKCVCLAVPKGEGEVLAKFSFVSKS